MIESFEIGTFEQSGAWPDHSHLLALNHRFDQLNVGAVVVVVVARW